MANKKQKYYFGSLLNFLVTWQLRFGQLYIVCITLGVQGVLITVC